MNRCMSIGVSASVGLSMLRVLTGLPIPWIHKRTHRRKSHIDPAEKEHQTNVSVSETDCHTHHLPVRITRLCAR